MINLSVDECYAFDYLSILYIKRNKSTEAYKSWQMCTEFLRGQMYPPFFDEIVGSVEYHTMIDANQKTFDLVDLAKENKCSAQDVDRGNYSRHQAKIKLQKRFFDGKMSEVKIGYEKYEK